MLNKFYRKLKAIFHIIIVIFEISKKENIGILWLLIYCIKYLMNIDKIENAFHYLVLDKIKNNTYKTIPLILCLWWINEGDNLLVEYKLETEYIKKRVNRYKKILTIIEETYDFNFENEFDVLFSS